MYAIHAARHRSRVRATAMLNCIRTNVSYLSQNIQSFNQV